MAKRKQRRTISVMTPAEKRIYDKEYRKSRNAGIDKWTAIKFARSMAKYGRQKETKKGKK